MTLAALTNSEATVSVTAGLARAVKGVKFHYKATSLTVELLETFRSMVNDAIRVCIEEDIHGRLKLRDRVYKELQERYGVGSCFPYSVSEVAWSIVKKHRRWHRKPFAKKLTLKMDSRNYSLHYSILSLPFKKGERVLVPLEYGDYQRAFLMDATLKRGSVTLTEKTVIVAFTKTTVPIEPVSRIGIDLNEKSAVCSNGRRYDLSEVARLHTAYGVRRKDFDVSHPRVRRLRKNFASSRREKERVRQYFHRKSNEIVETALEKKQTIVLEDLKGIRYAHEKGNGEGRAKRRRIGQWPFRALQAFIVYKANWAGVSVEFVNPALTSKTCHMCGLVNWQLKPNEREWRCPNCRVLLDRDLNAAINIERRGSIPCLGEVRPGAQDTDEAMKGNETTMAPIL